MKRLSTVLLVTALFSSSIYAQPAHDVLIGYTADKVMSDVFNDFSRQTSGLQTVVETSCSINKGINHEAIKQQWAKTFLSWMRIEPFSVGPVKNQNRDFKIYFWPIKKSKLLPVIDKKLSAENLKEYSIAGRGLAGLEYALYESSLQLTDQELCQYLIPVSGRLSMDAQELLSEWQGEEGFAAQMKNPDRNNKQFLATQDVINLLLGKIIQHSGGIVKTKLGLPVGTTPDKAKPYKVEARRSGLALQSLLAALDTYDALLVSDAWQGFQNEQADELQKLLSIQRANIANARSQINQIDLSLDELVKQDNNTARTLYDAFREIDTGWKEIAKVLNVSAGFNDNDGD